MTKKGRKQPQVVVIGAGISGLTVAAYLARAGHAVTVFEQFQDTGGVLATFGIPALGWAETRVSATQLISTRPPLVLYNGTVPHRGTLLSELADWPL